MLSKESWFDDKGIKSYKEFLRKDDKEINASMRRATSTGRVFGSENFIKNKETGENIKARSLSKERWQAKEEG